MIRVLKPGEQIPAGQPRRYGNRGGYIRLRWKIGKGEYVEALEHRVVDGRVTNAQAVHHKNHVKNDNRPENLAPMTRSEHGQAHGVFDRAEVGRLYESGLTTIQIADLFGTRPGNVSRMLAQADIVARPPAKRLPLDREEIARRLLAGERVGAIATSIGCSRTPIDDVRQSLGLPTFPAGRYYERPDYAR